MQQKNRDVKQAGKFGSNVKQAGNNNFSWLLITLLVFQKALRSNMHHAAKKITELPKNPDGTGQNIISFVETCFIVYLS